MALHRKWDHLLALEPDIAIVSESARPEIVEHKYGASLGATDVFWTGRLDHKGLALFTFGQWNGRLSAEL